MPPARLFQASRQCALHLRVGNTTLSSGLHPNEPRLTAPWPCLFPSHRFPHTAVLGKVPGSSYVYRCVAIGRLMDQPYAVPEGPVVGWEPQGHESAC